MKLLFLLPCLLAAVLMGQTTEVIRYKVGDTQMASTLALPVDATADQPRPAILILPNWMGPGPYYDAMAQEFARHGFVAMTVDMYGEDVRPKSLNEAAEAASKVGAGDRSMMRNRVSAAVKEIRNRPEVDKQRVVAIGFSFGGTACLELARAGSTINGVVSFHGGLSTPLPEDNRKIKTSLLVLQGSRDPYVPLEEVLKFLVQMRDTDVQWTFIEYSKATHAFTNPAANQKGKEEFDEAATLQAWEATFDFIGRRMKMDTEGLDNHAMLELLKKAAAVDPAPVAQPPPVAEEAEPSAAVE